MRGRYAACTARRTRRSIRGIFLTGGIVSYCRRFSSIQATKPFPPPSVSPCCTSCCSSPDPPYPPRSRRIDNPQQVRQSSATRFSDWFSTRTTRIGTPGETKPRWEAAALATTRTTKIRAATLPPIPPPHQPQIRSPTPLLLSGQSLRRQALPPPIPVPVLLQHQRRP